MIGAIFFLLLRRKRRKYYLLHNFRRMKRLFLVKKETNRRLMADWNNRVHLENEAAFLFQGAKVTYSDMTRILGKNNIPAQKEPA